MKFVVPAALLAIVTVGLTGCKHANKSTEPASTALTEPTPINPPAQSAPPVVVQPAPVNEAPMKESTASGASSSPKSSITGHKYTVQKGDTLFNIAARRYGHGTPANIAKIRNANPSLKGDTLTVGKVLTLP